MIKIETFQYQSDRGWSCDSFPNIDSNQTLVLIFGASSFQNSPEPLAELITAYPQAIISGCSSSGEIYGDQIHDETLVVAVARFEHTHLRFQSVTINDPADSFSCGEQLAKALQDPRLKGLFILSDGLNANGSDLVGGLSHIIDKKIIITGGLAGDGERFQNTWVLNDEHKPVSGVITAVGLYGDHVQLGYGSKGGWENFGPERLVTRAEANILYELDDKPALELYKNYLGDLAKDLPASGLLYPLAVRSDNDSEDRVVRTILAINEDEQSMTFAGNIPEGSLAQLMRASFDQLIEGAEDAAGDARHKSTHNDMQTLAVAISCVGRRLVFGERAEEEVEATLEALNKNTVQLGFYSYGEISPFAFNAHTN